MNKPKTIICDIDGVLIKHSNEGLSKQLGYVDLLNDTISKMNEWDRFWGWYDKHTTKSLIITAIIIYMQIPHMIWAGDVYLQLGIISHIHPVLDFFLYGIDLVEILPMINIGMLIYNKARKRK